MTSRDTTTELRAHVARLDQVIDVEAAFGCLFGAAPYAFWLDSSLLVDGLSRFSFLGDASGPLAEVLTYRVGDGAVLVESRDRLPRLISGSIFDVLKDRLARRQVTAPPLPFDLVGGYVGYLGYELKADCGASLRHRSPTPDAVWVFAERYLAVDHAAGRTYVVAIAPDNAAGAKHARAWIRRTRRSLTLHAMPRPAADSGRPQQDQRTTPEHLIDPAARLVRPRERYLDDVRTCRRHLEAGESYEICLTNQLRMPAPPDDVEFYRRLRRCNPAPYAGLLRLGGDLAIFSSSPERFLRVDARRFVESRPIKGTAPRSANPQLDEDLRRGLRASEKTRAENLMIVDLLRNDLGRVCEIGTVRVPVLMNTESYATVHQLVSSIRGKLRPDVSAVGCARACFPGGSMTGAPKLRSMELLDDLEIEARGVYAGAIGYFGSTGTADLSIVIRTAVRWRDQLTIGAGGAIVLDSEPVAEYDEMILKALAPLRALPGLASASASGRPPSFATVATDWVSGIRL